ncbi:hypothetical protein [Yoonia sp. SS1-5]|uniref:Uncharacterized protein n=1 Tax=Yoonia rhodophyticola TaxID=3137370 RepID=A0AAN0MHH1_9RHOB
MPRQDTDTTAPRPADQLSVPSKSEIIAALQQDAGRAGLRLEWVLDRCVTAKAGGE